VIFRQLYSARDASFTYLLADPRERDAIVIDPQPDQDELIMALLAERDLRLTRVLRTHVHSGASGACEGLCRHTGAELVVGAGTSCCEAKRVVAHGDTLVFGSEVLRVLATPGHTPGSVSYLWRDRLFCGDALLLRGCSTPDDPAVDVGRLFDSVTLRLFLLADETLIFPGHANEGRTVSTIAEERQRNPYFSGKSRDDFATMMARIQRESLQQTSVHP